MKRNKINKSAHQESGKLVISLDFELFWGMRDKTTIEEYKQNLLGVREIIPSILNLFKKYTIHATWAVIGFIFYKDRNSLVKDLPAIKPNWQKTGQIRSGKSQRHHHQCVHCSAHPDQ